MAKEFATRKKESSEGGEGEWGDEKLFKRSNKTQRTPEGVGKVEGNGVEEMLRGWRKKIGDVMMSMMG